MVAFIQTTIFVQIVIKFWIQKQSIPKKITITETNTNPKTQRPLDISFNCSCSAQNKVSFNILNKNENYAFVEVDNNFGHFLWKQKHL